MQNFITLIAIAFVSTLLVSCSSLFNEEQQKPIRIKIIDKSTYSYQNDTKIVTEKNVITTLEKDVQPSTMTPIDTPSPQWLSPVDAKVKTPFTKQSGLMYFDTAAGQEIKAIQSGKVVYSSGNLKSFGNMVIIKHKFGFYSHYMYTNELLVSIGDDITQGMVIATTSDTPLALQMKKYTKIINPEQYILSE